MKCLIYTRVSTDDQNAENQLTQLQEYANRQQWEIVAIKKDTCSGSRSASERTGLKEVFKLARQKQFDV